MRIWARISKRYRGKQPEVRPGSIKVSAFYLIHVTIIPLLRLCTTNRGRYTARRSRNQRDFTAETQRTQSADGDQPDRAAEVDVSSRPRTTRLMPSRSRGA